MRWPKFRTNTQIENSAKRIFDLGIQGVITKENALDNLFMQHKRARTRAIKDKSLIIFNISGKTNK